MRFKKGSAISLFFMIISLFAIKPTLNIDHYFPAESNPVMGMAVGFDEKEYLSCTGDPEDIFSQGTITVKYEKGKTYMKTISDKCYDGQIYEYYCEGSSPALKRYTCPGECESGRCLESGTYCGDGYINQGSEMCDGEDTGTNNCKDYGYAGGKLGCSSDCTYDFSECTNCKDTDQLSYYTKGTVNEKYTDYCADYTKKSVVEFHCTENCVSSVVYRCPHGCFEGRCVYQHQTCEPGFICAGRGLAFLNSDCTRSNFVDCPEETACTEGACVSQ